MADIDTVLKYCATLESSAKSATLNKLIETGRTDALPFDKFVAALAGMREDWKVNTIEVYVTRFRHTIVPNLTKQQLGSLFAGLRDDWKVNVIRTVMKECPLAPIDPVVHLKGMRDDWKGTIYLDMLDFVATRTQPPVAAVAVVPAAVMAKGGGAHKDDDDNSKELREALLVSQIEHQKKEIQDLKKLGDKQALDTGAAPAVVKAKVPIVNAAGIKTTEKTEKGDKACVVCLENLKHVASLPCSHVTLCLACANSSGPDLDKCPVCQKPVLQWIVMAL